MGLEADVTPQTKRPELVSSQAQSLTKKYQETKELLKLQELKKRNMQAQLGLTLSHLPVKEANFSESQNTSVMEGPPPDQVQKTVSFLLQDTSEAIQQLEDQLPGRPLTLRELGKLLKLLSFNQEAAGKHELQKLLETWKCQQEIENEMIKKSLARAGESIREYEARLLTMEGMMGKVKRQSYESPYGPLSKIENHSEANDATVGLLSQKIELLSVENSALKQRCQEIVNQLTEADREIDRLKAELIAQQGSKQHHLLMEELKRLKAELAENQANAIDREYYERELNEKSLRLHEALVTLEELGSTLKDTEKKLQLKEATLIGLGFQTDDEDEELHPEKDQLRELLEASQAKFFETERRLQSAEQCCLELEARNSELVALNQETEKVGREKVAEVENEARMLRERLEVETSRNEKNVGDSVDAGEKQVDDKGLFKQVVDEFEMRSKAIDEVVRMLEKVDVKVEKMLSHVKSTLFSFMKDEPLCMSGKDMRSVLEWEFWTRLLSVSESDPDENRQMCKPWLVEQITAQESLLLLNRRLRSQSDAECQTALDFASMCSWLDDETNALIFRRLIETLEAKSRELRQIASGLQQDKDDKLLSLAVASFGLGQERKQPSEHVLESLKEAYTSYVVIRLKVQHGKELKLNQTQPQMGSLDYLNGPEMTEVASNFQSKAVDHQTEPSRASLETVSIQTERDLPLDSLDDTTELHDMAARHKKELQEVKDQYKQEAEELKQQIAKSNETLHLCSEENAKEVESLTNCVENLKKQHEMERRDLVERFDREMEELRSMMSPANPDRTGPDGPTPSPPFSAQTSTLRERIQELLTQVSVMTEEMRRREEQGDITTLRLKYERDLENLKVEALLVLAVLPSVMPCFPLWHSQNSPPFTSFPNPRSPFSRTLLRKPPFLRVA